jgi:hypothetical protein
MEVLTFHPPRPLPPSAEEKAEATFDRLMAHLAQSEEGFTLIYDLRELAGTVPGEVLARAAWTATGAAIGGAS